MLRTQAIADSLSTVRQYHSDHQPDRFGNYIGSIIHMSVNRLFAVNQRTYELLVYHHLYRAYQSISARKSV